jgi:YbbR domain-containing protein
MSQKPLNNLYIKILAIAFAIFLWIFVINQGFKIDFLEKEIPIKAYNLADDLSLASDLGTVKLKIRAPKSFWQEYSDDSIQAYVDLLHFDKGIYNVEVKVSSEDSSIQIVEKDPEKISVVIDSITSVKKEIEVETEGSLAQDYSVDEPYTEPKEIEIKGAKGTLDAIDKVKIKIELNGESAEVRKRTTPEVINKEGNIITNIILDPSEIEVIIPVLKNTEVKTVSVNSKIIGNPASGYSIDNIEVNPSTISIQGKSEDLAEINYIDTEEVNIEGITDTTEKKVSLNLPENIKSVEIEKVTIKVNVSSSIKSESVTSPIKFNNLDSNLEIISYTPSEITITVKGKKEEIDKLKDNPPSVNIDLKNTTRGTHSFTVDKSIISLPSGIELVSVDNKEVRVGLEEK